MTAGMSLLLLRYLQISGDVVSRGQGSYSEMVELALWILGREVAEQAASGADRTH